MIHNYEKKNVMTFVDNIESSEEVTELDESSQQAVYFDKDSIKDPNPELLIAQIMSGITTPFRMPGH